MKKFLIAIIFLIPILVVLAIQGAGAAIVAFAPKVNAETIEVRDAFNEKIEGGRVVVPRFNNDGNDGEEFIYINVYPKVAYSDKVLFECSEEEGYDGRCQLQRVEDNKYKIVAKKNGDVLMKIYSETNDNAYKMLNIYITSDVITDLCVYAEFPGGAEKINEAQVIDATQKLRLFPYACPIEAIGNNLMRWESSDESIVHIDRNGVVKPVGLGTVKITLYVNDKTGLEHFTFFYINTNTNIFLRETQISINQEYFLSFSDEEKMEFLMENLVVVGENEDYSVNDMVCLLEDNDKLVYSIGGKELIVNLTNQDDIVFESDYLSDIYIENGGYYLDVCYADYLREDKPVVRYEISDESIITITGGKINLLKEGSCEVVAVDIKTGARTEAIKINVKRRIASFQLKYTNFDNERGIKQERVWAQNWINDDGSFSNVYNLGYDLDSVLPDTSYFDLLWEIDNTQYATIAENGDITFLPEGNGKEFTVTATVLVHGIKTGLHRSYKFLMVNDIEAVNVDNLNDFKEVISRGKAERPAVLQSNIIIENESINANNSLYGNGYLLDFHFPDEEFRYSNALIFDKNNYKNDLSELNVENFTLQCDDNFLDGYYKYNAIVFYDTDIPVNFKYVISRYNWIGMNITRNHSDFLIEGCILGHSGMCGLYFNNNYENDQNVMGTITLKNNVFRETGCASLATTPSNLSTEINDKNYIPHIILDGFFDCYNWKKTDELQAIFDSLDPNIFGDLASYKNTLSKLLGNMLEVMFENEPYKDMVYYDEEDQGWVCMGLFSLGLFNYIDSSKFDLSRTDEFELLEVALDEGTAEILKKLLKIEVGMPNYFLSYKFDNETGPLIKPNDVCPENEALFTRLKGEE